MKKTVVLLGLLTVAAWFAGGAAYAANLVVNGDFADGLNNWDANANVFVSPSERAVLVDGIAGVAGPSDASLLQVVPLLAGKYTIDFDFLNGLSDAVAPFAFFDTFFATLYFSSDGSTPDSEIDLFDMDFSGPSNNQGTITPNGTDQHFHMVFTNSEPYAMPAFDLAGLNGIVGDSTVEIDNVSITPVPSTPEPATMLLLGIGLFAGAVRKALAK